MAAAKGAKKVATTPEPDKVCQELEKLILGIVKAKLPTIVPALKDIIVERAKDPNSYYSVAESWAEDYWFDGEIQDAIDTWIDEHTKLEVVFK